VEAVDIERRLAILLVEYDNVFNILEVIFIERASTANHNNSVFIETTKQDSIGECPKL
jgi:hypothetical protein